MKAFLAIVIAILFLSACASGPVATSQASDVPSSRILTKRWLSPSSGTGTLIVKRDSGFTGAICPVRVHVDNTAVSDLMPSEKIELFLPVGDRVVRATTTGLCREGESEIKIAISSKMKRVLRIVTGESEGIKLQSTTF